MTSPFSLNLALEAGWLKARLESIKFLSNYWYITKIQFEDIEYNTRWALDRARHTLWAFLLK